MKMLFSPRCLVLTFSLLLLIGCGSTPKLSTPASLDGRPAYNLKVYDRVSELIARLYFDETLGGVDWPSLVQKHRNAAESAFDDTQLYAAINRLLAELKNPHCRATPAPHITAERPTYRIVNGTFIIGQPGKPRIVYAVMKDSPADVAGVRPGWIEIGREKREFEGRPPRVRERYTCDYLDENDQPRTVEMLLDNVPLNFPPEVRTLADGFVYLRFDYFAPATAIWLQEQLKTHTKAPGIILDLRFNQGGSNRALESIASSLFTGETALGFFIARKTNPDLPLPRTRPNADAYSGKIAVLMSERTTGCAEALAHLIQHHGRGHLLLWGNKTSHSPFALENWPLPDGGELDIPTCNYLGLDHQPLQFKSHVITFQLPPIEAEDLRADRDTHLKSAIDFLRTR